MLARLRVRARQLFSVLYCCVEIVMVDSVHSPDSKQGFLEVCLNLTMLICIRCIEASDARSCEQAIKVRMHSTSAKCRSQLLRHKTYKTCTRFRRGLAHSWFFFLFGLHFLAEQAACQTYMCDMFC